MGAAQLVVSNLACEDTLVKKIPGPASYESTSPFEPNQKLERRRKNTLADSWNEGISVSSSYSLLSDENTLWSASVN